MKYLLKISFVVFIGLIWVSCSEEKQSFYNNEANLFTLNNVFKKQAITERLQSKSENPLNEEEAKEMLTPIIHETVSVLINSGITEDEIILEFGSIDAPEIALAGIAMLTEGEEASKTYLAKSRPDVLDCAARAFVGMELHAGFWSSFTTRRAMLRVVGRLAARTLGFVGAALIVYDFADCMWN